MTAKERIRNILILEEMKKNPKEAMRLGLVVKDSKKKENR